MSEESTDLLIGLEKQLAGCTLDLLEKSNQLTQEIVQHQLTQAELYLVREVMENASQAVVITDANNIIVEVNKAYIKMTGFTREIAIGSKPSIGKSGRHDKTFYQKMWKELTENNQWEGEVWDRRVDGSVFPKHLKISRLLNGDGDVVKYVAVFEDLTYKKEAEKELEKLIYYDHLTGLSNQTLFRHHLEHEFDVSNRHNFSVALLLLNLDRFREINEKFGYVIGDELIKEVALRLEGMVRKTDLIARAKQDKGRHSDTLSRLGGNEFSVILSELDKPENASVVARRIMAIMDEPFNIKEQEIHICISMGISTYPENATNLNDIILCAEQAINDIRKNGGNSFQFYSEQTNKTSRDCYILETKLRKALDKQEFFISYQPKIDLSKQKIMGMEALIRWRQEDGSVISPVDFIPLAEDTGLILPIGEWVFRQACIDTQALTKQFNFPFKIAVNLSARQFQYQEVERLTQKILDETSLPAEQLELEITESMVMNDVEKSITTMNKLNDMGVSLAIDDFGTGYSSLAYLKKFPVQTLKIDRAFVYELEKNRDDAAIVATICSMGHQLGISLVAEGIETEQQMNFLNEQSCQYGQGYYLSRPIVLTDLIEFIKSNN